MSIAEQLELISQGIDPTTGEVFSTSVFVNDPRCNNAIRMIAISAFPKMKFPKPIPANTLGRPVDAIFQKMKAWRLEIAKTIGLPAYCVFSDQELYNNEGGDVTKKEDLLQCRGINSVRYELYGDDLFDIIMEFAEE